MNRFLIFAITFVFSIGLSGCASSPDGSKKPAANANTSPPAQTEAKPSPAENKNADSNSTDFGKSDADRSNSRID